ncbi:MAG: adenylyl-sulfate kinase [Magnetococcales bacterium]|nr:adenylyl-sulfate kinase [Magnetococcales bacterium]
MTTSRSSNTVWHPELVSREDRERLNGHRGLLVWYTGLSGSGKSTMAHGTARLLHQQGVRTFVLDGDNVRHGLCADLGFSNADRQENIRRIAEVARLLVEAGQIVLAAFISPFRADRQRARNLIPPGDFIEVYCHCSLEVCEERDVKGLYRKAREGIIRDFTGISSPYEAPEQAELVLRTDREEIPTCLETCVELILERTRLNHSSS